MTDCEKQLRDMCESYAKDAITGEMCFWPRESEDDEEWYQAYSIRYMIDGSGKYLGARLMIAGGGPVVWVDTSEGEIQGFWGSDRCSFPIYDYEYIDDYFEDQYGCLS
tara:strand:- start:200 stop:523 length:324 start_codon:yes stop_codon:yes gene_type:complete